MTALYLRHYGKHGRYSIVICSIIYLDRYSRIEINHRLIQEVSVSLGEKSTRGKILMNNAHIVSYILYSFFCFSSDSKMINHV